MGTLSNNLLINLIAGTIVLMVSTSFPAYAKKVKKLTDPALVQALHQETYDTQTKVTDMDLLIWLSAMSSKLERRIPNAFYRIRLLSAIYRESRAEGLDPQLVLALIDVERNFDRNALSHAGAQGLMQVMPFWKKEIGRPEDNLIDALTNLRYGCRILQYYITKEKGKGGLSMALARYNGSYPRTVYSEKVMNAWQDRWNTGEK